MVAAKSQQSFSSLRSKFTGVPAPRRNQNRYWWRPIGSKSCRPPPRWHRSCLSCGRGSAGAGPPSPWEIFSMHALVSILWSIASVLSFGPLCSMHQFLSLGPWVTFISSILRPLAQHASVSIPWPMGSMHQFYPSDHCASWISFNPLAHG